MEIAVSKHFKYESGQGHVRHNVTDERLPLDEIGTKIRIYEDRVNGWFFDHAHAAGDGSGYVVLQIAVSQVEGLEQFRQGKSTPRGKAGEWFKRSLCRIPNLGTTNADAITTFYTAVRCGLFHTGFTNGPVFTSPEFDKAIDLVDGLVMVNPQMFLRCVEDAIKQYIRDLMDEENRDLRRNFSQLWDDQWMTAKSGSNILAAISHATGDGTQ